MPEFRLATPNRRAQYYPRFSTAEFERRWDRTRTFMEERELDALLVYGDAGAHEANMFYLTNYEPTFATYLAFFADQDAPTTIFTGISNHVQYIREVSEVEEIRMMLPDPPSNVIDRLEEAGVDDGRIGLVCGDPRYNLSIPAKHHRMLEHGLSAELVDSSAAFTQFIAVAGEDELDRVRRASEILDEAMHAFEAAAEPGMTELDLRAVLEDTCSEAGGSLGADFISSAPMENAEPGEGLTWKRPSQREIEAGDVITTEISAGYRGYQSQIHRPYTVGDDPSSTYQDLFAVAEETYERLIDSLQAGNSAADVHAAMAPVEASEFKIYDVMVHGYGGAYRHPFIGVEESNYWPGADDPLTERWVFEPGNVIVVQPNVITPDETAGLQFGTTVIIHEQGPEVLHEYPATFQQV